MGLGDLKKIKLLGKKFVEKSKGFHQKLTKLGRKVIDKGPQVLDKIIDVGKKLKPVVDGITDFIPGNEIIDKVYDTGLSIAQKGRDALQRVQDTFGSNKTQVIASKPPTRSNSVVKQIKRSQSVLDKIKNKPPSRPPSVFKNVERKPPSRSSSVSRKMERKPPDQTEIYAPTPIPAQRVIKNEEKRENNPPPAKPKPEKVEIPKFIDSKDDFKPKGAPDFRTSVKPEVEVPKIDNDKFKPSFMNNVLN